MKPDVLFKIIQQLTRVDRFLDSERTDAHY